MIGELCAYVRNYFLRDYKDPAKYIHDGHYKIEDGNIQSLPFLIQGQYFRIKGSALNDGVYVYGATQNGLTDEEFDGQIWVMYVPPDFISLANEISAWCTANANALSSPYQSESFGGYSYSLKSGGGAAGADGYSWQSQFTKRLAPYRRLSVL